MRLLSKELKDDKLVFNIRIGYSELELINGLLEEMLLKIPKTVFEMTPVRNRIRTMLKITTTEVTKHRSESKGYNVKDYINNDKQTKSIQSSTPSTGNSI